MLPLTHAFEYVEEWQCYRVLHIVSDKTIDTTHSIQNAAAITRQMNSLYRAFPDF